MKPYEIKMDHDWIINISNWFIKLADMCTVAGSIVLASVLLKTLDVTWTDIVGNRGWGNLTSAIAVILGVFAGGTVIIILMVLGMFKLEPSKMIKFIKSD